MALILHARISCAPIALESATRSGHCQPWLHADALRYQHKLKQLTLALENMNPTTGNSVDIDFLETEHHLFFDDTSYIILPPLYQLNWAEKDISLFSPIQNGDEIALIEYVTMMPL